MRLPILVLRIREALSSDDGLLNPSISVEVPVTEMSSRGDGRDTNVRKRAADTQEEQWVADEDRFVLQQAKATASIRAKNGRAKPIDWLALTLGFIDATQQKIDDDWLLDAFEIKDPVTVFESLDARSAEELEKDIDTYLALETDKQNRDFWNTMKLICKDQRGLSGDPSRAARGVSSVNDDVDKILSPKSLEDLEALEAQIRQKLRSDPSIDLDYWEHLLRRLLVWKAKAKLRKVSASVTEQRSAFLRKQQHPQEASLANDQNVFSNVKDHQSSAENKKRRLDEPEASLDQQNDPPANHLGDQSSATAALYAREAARGIKDNEEVFAEEEDLGSTTKPKWADKYRPRKPRYFNRVQMGYEWNKYNQTHYDHDNPPPKVVQGYKFNVFYPELIDKTKTPTYRIERENGRKRGQSSVPAGQEDTCIIRFIAGPPYQDIAFRIVDKEWGYSAKGDRGFKSSFDKGILQLHFQFKKVYYRK